MASRKLFDPGPALYQCGRGGEPMIEVGSVTPADALYIVSSLVVVASNPVRRVLDEKEPAFQRAPSRTAFVASAQYPIANAKLERVPFALTRNCAETRSRFAAWSHFL